MDFESCGAQKCIAIDPKGTIGFCNIFNNYPRKPKLFDPFLALSVGQDVWVLADKTIVKGGMMKSCVEQGTDPYCPDRKGQKYWGQFQDRIKKVKHDAEISYFGHFPIVDIEYQTDAPVSVGLRAWAPFLPGDIQTSDTPAAIFEVNLRNTSGQQQQGKIAFTFDAPALYQNSSEIKNGLLSGQ